MHNTSSYMVLDIQAKTVSTQNGWTDGPSDLLSQYTDNIIHLIQFWHNYSVTPPAYSISHKPGGTSKY